MEKINKLIDDNNGKLVLFFSASWCVPCKSFKEMLIKTKDKNDNFTLEIIDVESCPSAARRFGITGLPTAIEFDNDKVKDYYMASEINRLIDSLRN